VYHLANDPNRTRINLPLKLDLSQDAGIEIAFDLAALFNSPEPISFATDGSSTCHKPASSFSDGFKQSIGINGGLTRRHSMPLFNLAWKDRFFWDD
jgi:hypothetical protein